MAIYSVKATKKQNVYASEGSTVAESPFYSHSGGNFKEIYWVLFSDRVLREIRGEICWSGFKTSAYSTWRFERSVSVCCSSPPDPSWRCRSGVVWSPSPARTISHNTLHHQCCLQRRAEQKTNKKKRPFSKMTALLKTHMLFLPLLLN